MSRKWLRIFLLFLISLKQTQQVSLFADVVLPAGSTQWSTDHLVPSESIFVGFGTTSDLQVSNSAVTSTNLRLGQTSTEVGHGTLTLSNSTWTSTGNVVLGSAALDEGFLNVNDLSIFTITGTGLFTGGSGKGTVDVSGGGKIVTSITSTGANAGSQGTLNVSGTNSSVSSTSTNFVGAFGTGQLNVLNGGTVSGNTTSIGTNASGVGTVLVDGSGSLLHATNSHFVGGSGQGTLAIRNGGRVTGNLASVGANSGSLGILNIDGTNSELSSTTTNFIGASGVGTANVTGGGLLAGNRLTIGANSTGIGVLTVAGLGSKVQATENIYVGEFGNGQLHVNSGANVTANLVSVGANEFSSGILNVSGTNSELQTVTDNFIGASGRGDLTIVQGALVQGSRNVVGTSSTSLGTVTVEDSGSRFLASTTNFIGYGGVGILNILNGGLSSAQFHVIGQNDTPVINGAYVSLVAVGGAGSVLNSQQLTTVAHAGRGILTVNEAGNAIGSLVVGAKKTGWGQVYVDGMNSLIQSSGDHLIGGGGRGQLFVRNGGRFSGFNTTIGSSDGENDFITELSLGNGEATVDGAGSLLESDGSLLVGKRGVGSLTISNHGQVSTAINNIFGSDSGTATVIVTSNGTLLGDLNHIGESGSASLLVSNGGIVSGYQNVVGRGGTGTAIIDGIGSVLKTTEGPPRSSITFSNNFVGTHGGVGTLIVRNGATVSGVDNIIGGEMFDQYSPNTSGTTTIDGAGSSLVASALNIVGYTTNGFLVVQNGGQAIAPTTTIANDPNSFGHATVDGNGSAIRSQNVYVGGSDHSQGGTGELVVRNGGVVSIGANGSLTVYSSGIVDVNGGSIEIPDGRIINNGVINHSGGFQFGPETVLTGNGVWNGSLTVDNGTTIAPGNSPGNLTFNGNQAFGPGTVLDFEFLDPNGVLGLGWDHITFNGDLSLNATAIDRILLRLSTLHDASTVGAMSGFDPNQNYMWEILSATSVLGFDPSSFSIDTTNFANVINGDFSVIYSSGSVSLVYSSVAVPEPTSICLLSLVACLGVYRRRFQRNS